LADNISVNIHSFDGVEIILGQTACKTAFYCRDDSVVRFWLIFPIKRKKKPYTVA